MTNDFLKELKESEFPEMNDYKRFLKNYSLTPDRSSFKTYVHARLLNIKLREHNPEIKHGLNFGYDEYKKMTKKASLLKNALSPEFANIASKKALEKVDFVIKKHPLYHQVPKIRDYVAKKTNQASKFSNYALDKELGSWK